MSPPYQLWSSISPAHVYRQLVLNGNALKENQPHFMERRLEGYNLTWYFVVAGDTLTQ